MRLYQSNRDNPEYVKYFHTLADIIGVFWQYHKACIAEGKREFSYLSVQEDISFNPQKLIDRALSYRTFNGKDIVKEYALGTFMSLEASWSAFLEAIDSNGDCQSEKTGSARFIDPYVATLCQNAEELGEKLGQYQDDRRMKQVVTRALGTGTKVTTHLVALFGDEFTPLLPVIISKVREDKIAEREMGIPQPWVEEAGSDGVEVNYRIFDSEDGLLNKQRLFSLGYGRTLGCPASMPVSKPTKAFLETKGIVFGRTMLEEYAQMARNGFNQTVREWYKGLGEKEKRVYLSGDSHNLLNGSIREAVVHKQVSACPYAKERM